MVRDHQQVEWVFGLADYIVLVGGNGGQSVLSLDGYIHPQLSVTTRKLQL